MKRFRWSTSIALLIGATGWLSGCQKAVHYDVIIKNANLIDGKSESVRRADIAIRDRRIVFIGRLGSATADYIIDARQAYVTPGFIDLRNRSAENLIKDRSAEFLTSQGISTVVLNTDGGIKNDIWPVAAYLYQFENNPASVNVAILAGHHTLRHLALKDSGFERPASREELLLLEVLLDRAMRDGALGLSINLAMGSGAYALEEELVRLIRRVRENEGVVMILPRDPVRRFWKSLEELRGLQQKTAQKLLIGRLRPTSRKVWQAKKRWQSYLSDSMIFCVAPFETWLGEITELVPQHEYFNWREIRKSFYYLGGAHLIKIARFPSQPAFEGKPLTYFARAQEISEARAFMEIVKDHDARVAITMQKPGQLNRMYRHANFLPVTDEGLDIDLRHTRPGFWHFIEQTVIRDSVLTLPQAISKLTSFPAEVLGLSGRGVLARGHFADIAIFTINKKALQSSKTSPQKPLITLTHLFVNGSLVWPPDRPLASRPGMVLKSKEPARLHQTSTKTN